MTLTPNGSAAPRRVLRNRSRPMVSVLAVVVVLTATACVVDGRPVRDQSPTAAELGLPEQSLLAMPMRRQPVPGWTLTAADLGLDPGGGLRYSPVGNVGDRAIFQAVSARGWWVIGVDDVGNGSSLFEPVWLGAHGSAEAMLASACYASGPSMVVCLRDGPKADSPAHAWVIDTDTGALLYEGPTDLSWSLGKDAPTVHQLGD